MDFGWSGKSQIVTALHNNNSRNTGKFLFRRLTYSCKFIIQAIVIQELLMHHNNYWYIEYATSELNIQLEKKEDQSAIVETKKLSDIHSTFCLLYLSISLFSNYIRKFVIFQPQLKNFVLAIFLTRLTVQSDSVLVYLLDDFLALFLSFFFLSLEACHLLVDSICCFLHWRHLLIGNLKIRLCITPAGQIVVMRESLRVMVGYVVYASDWRYSKTDLTKKVLLTFIYWLNTTRRSRVNYFVFEV